MRVFAEDSADWNIDLSGLVTCEACGEEPATIHLLRAVDGAVSHTHLCPSCAEEMAEQSDGLALVLAVPSALRNLVRQVPNPEPVAPVTAKDGDGFCSVCGTTLTDIKESGLVGCANCYQVFADYLEKTLPAGTGAAEHMGKIPHRGPESDNLRHEIMRLERMLRELVECERFEEAAGVRDRLSQLGERLEDGS